MMNKQTEASLLECLRTLPAELLAGFPISLVSSRLVGHFFKCTLQSEFRQTFFENARATLAQLTVIGPNGVTLNEGRLFSLTSGEEGVLRLDRLVRLLHVLNHFIVQGRREPLIVSVHHLLFSYVTYGHGKPFATLLQHFGLDPADIVLILPDEIMHSAENIGTLAAYTTQGFSVCTRDAIGDENMQAHSRRSWSWEGEKRISGRRWDGEENFQRI